MKRIRDTLNKLIKKWWKPFWITLKTKIKIHELEWFYDDQIIQFELDCVSMGKYVRLRELVSMESWLWQFICDNKLYNRTYNFREDVCKTWYNIWWFSHNFQYWILESALIQEKDLPKFLIDNIII